MDAASASAPRRDNTTPSCTVCQRRKVKCNRVYPCAPCTKTGLECSYKSVNRLRQKRVKRPSLSQEVDREGDASTGRRGSSPAASASSTQRDKDETLIASLTTPNTARLVREGGGYRYLNNHLWSSLPVLASKDSTDGPALSSADGSSPGTWNACSNVHSAHLGNNIFESSVQRSDEAVAGAPGSRSFLFKQEANGRPVPQPTPAQVVQLWQVYLSNVDPMMKVFHGPTVQQLVLGQIGTATLTANEEALVSAIYFVSIVSLNDSECRISMQEPRESVVRRFRRTTEDALSNVDFVTTTDLKVLQALILYLAALRSLGDTQTVWSLTGLAIRIAGTIGLARDGDFLDLPPFESEIRRRLWWAIVYLDARTAELVGQDGDLLVSNYDVKRPSNLNDSELNPSMSRLPEARTCSGEVVYVQLRATLALCLRRMPKLNGPGGTWKQMEGSNVSTDEKINLVESLEKQFKDEILDYCDPAVPLQLFTINSASTFLTKMRLVAQIPQSKANSQVGVAKAYSENKFQLSMRLMQLQLEVFLEPCLQRWRWHWQGQFQWYALACLIQQTRLRHPGPVTVKAWTMIQKVFDAIIPTLSLGPRKSPILVAIRSLLNTAKEPQKHHANHDSPQTSATPISESDTNPAISNMVSPKIPESKTAPGVSLPPNMNVSPGSQPHGALLPGMVQHPGANPTNKFANICSAGSPANAQQVHGVDFDDPMLGIDFGAIDWVEFDRLTTELCSQGP